MKLNKILIPLCSVASIAAIVTPIATSCSQTLAIKEWKKSNGPYHFEYPCKPAASIDAGKITSVYYDDVKVVPTILCEDFVWDFSRDTEEGEEKYNEVRIELYKLSANSDKSAFKIDFKFYLDRTTTDNKHLQEYYNYKNVWFRINYRTGAASEQEKWRLEYINLENTEEMWKDQDWSLELNKTIDGVKQDQLKFDYKTKTMDPSKIEEVETHLCRNLWFFSNYLKNIEKQ